MPGAVKPEGLCSDVRRSRFIVRNSALLCVLLKKPQNFQISNQKWKIQVDKKNSYCHGNLQFTSKSTIKISG